MKETQNKLGKTGYQFSKNAQLTADLPQIKLQGQYLFVI